MVRSYLSTKFGVNSLDGFWENAFYWRTDGRMTPKSQISIHFALQPPPIFESQVVSRQLHRIWMSPKWPGALRVKRYPIYVFMLLEPPSPNFHSIPLCDEKFVSKLNFHLPTGHDITFQSFFKQAYRMAPKWPTSTPYHPHPPSQIPILLALRPIIFHLICRLLMNSVVLFIHCKPTTTVRERGIYIAKFATIFKS